MDNAEKHAASELEANRQKLNSSSGQLDLQVRQLLETMNGHPFNDPTQGPEDVLVSLGEVKESLDSFEATLATFGNYQVLFGGIAHETKSIKIANESYDKLDRLWTRMKSWDDDMVRYYTSDFTELLNPEKNKDGFNGAKFESRIEEFMGEVRQMERALKGNLVVASLKEKIMDFRGKAGIVTQIGHPALKERHWVEIHKGLKDTSWSPGRLVKLEALEKLGVFDEKNLDMLDTICGAAGKEYSMLKTNEKMQASWDGIEFVFVDYKGKGTHIVSSVDDIQALLDDQIVKVTTMKGSPYAKPFFDDISQFEKKLQLIQAIVEELLKVQAGYM